ncbi:MAG TPA: hypothetical protein V6C65_01065 [Allocoleopsis sp.]
MTIDEIIELITTAENYLKDTTQGYQNHPKKWYDATTTHWYKGLHALDEAVDELRKHRINVSIAISPLKGLVVGNKIQAVISCQ